MTLRAATKSKRKQRPATCPDCHGEMQPVVVTVHSRDGEPMPGIQVVHVPCAPCNSTGKVRRAEPTPCCCSSDCEPCANCAPKPRGIHVCINDDFENWDRVAALAVMDSPGKVRGTAGRNSTAADLGQGERAAKYR